MNEELQGRAKYVCNYFGATDGTMATVPAANREECARTIKSERAELIALKNADMREAILAADREERAEAAEAKAAAVAPAAVFARFNRRRR